MRKVARACFAVVFFARFPRPDVSVAVDPDALLTNGPNNFEITTEGNTDTPENNGNLDNIAPSP